MADDDDDGGGGGWLISYADLMTLLFAAFVVLYGITPQGESSVILGILSSIRESFIEIPEEILEDERKGQQFNAKRIFTRAKTEVILNPVIKKFNREKTDIVGKNKDMQRIEILLEEKAKGDGLHYELRQGTQVISTETGFRLRLAGTAYFDGESAELTTTSRKLLADIGEILKESERKMTVEGHTDARPASGRYSNLEIGALRASAVRQILVADVGIHRDRVHTATYGGLHPVATSQTKNGRKKNRRVEIKVVYN